jgi:epoxyqueuosine reductase
VKERIRQRALELGFEECRFTSADAPDHAVEFQRWLGEKRHGEMNYLERNAPKRVAPNLVLPGAKSIIVLAVSYAGAGMEEAVSAPPSMNLSEKTASSPLPSPPLRRRGRSSGEERPSVPSMNVEQSVDNGLPLSPFGKREKNDMSSDRSCHGFVARYARFDDYHEIIGAKLKELTTFVNEQGASRSLWYVDTGPLLERDLAQRAGIGFVGKHTNLISRRFGNWILLSEIITTLELEPDLPEKNRCGSCTSCIEACPTAAITGPFQLDARRCISYLTIELKGSIPVEFRRALGNRIYGCDDCLAACPWNRFAREGAIMRGHARNDLSQPDLLELLSLDQAGFKKRFAGTPMMRTKRRGLLRNVCVALGNVGDESALPALRRAAQDCEPLVAEHAAWAILEIEERCAVTMNCS